MDFLRLAAMLGLALLAGPAASAAATPARVSAPFHSPTRFSVETVGSGPDVILIPGLTASKEVWRPTVASLPGYRYHLVQVAGFSGAPARGNARGPIVAPLAEELARYIYEHHLDRPAIVGHSMGGTIAMMIAARHPERVGKVMVVDMLPEPAGLVGSNADRIAGLAGLLEGLSNTPEGRGLVASAIRMFGSDPEGDSRSDPDVVARAAQELALTDLRRDLPRISAPLTVVYASLDASQNNVADREYRIAYAGKPGARLVRIDRSGHMIMYDQPAAFRRALRSFLAG
jgi:pimeloyl-ACP methyl ester carboxylesterase